ncbi:MAG: ABC transporter permease [Acidobacteriia bacterium]|nr:ABC transporter permease [Terriglobia bacterium]
MNTLRQDLRYAFRMLWRNPGFALVAVLTLAMGIAANSAIFSVVNGLLLHPAGIREADHVLAIRAKYDQLNLKSISISAPDFADVRDSKEMFSSAAASIPASFNYTVGDVPQRLSGASVSWQWFDAFGATPLLGRMFRPEEDQPNANQVVILSFNTWRDIFGSDPTLVGKKIELNQQIYEVVGVMRPDFNWPAGTQLWAPLGLPPQRFAPASRFNENLFVVARVRSNVPVPQAINFVQILTQRFLQGGAGAAYAKDAGWGMFALPLTEFLYGNLKTPMFILFGAVAFVLLIACSNIAGLMLARSAGRGRELAIRVALGARRGHLIRQAFTESLLLSGLGTLLGLALSQLGIRALLWLGPQDVVKALVIRTDLFVLSFTAVIGILSGLLFGVVPAWHVAGVHQFELLKEGGRSGVGSRGQSRLRTVLVSGEVALALVLLVGAGLLLKSLGRMQQVNPGFQPRGVLTAALALPQSHYSTPEQRIAFYQALANEMMHLPGVSSAALATPIPFSGFDAAASFDIQGRVLAADDPGPHSGLCLVTPGYFATLSIPLLRGRVFTDADRQNTQPVAVIDDTLARQYWPNQDPIGQQIRRGSQIPWATIVGVVGHVDHTALVGDSGKGVTYYPGYQVSFPSGFLVAKTSLDPLSLIGGLRAAVRTLDPNLPAYNFVPMKERVDNSLGPQRFVVSLLGFFAVVALLMAALGLYGIISYSVSQRTQELGVRVALGARPGQVLGLVLRQGLLLAGAGLVVGVLASFALSRAISSQLFDVSAFDPVTFLTTALILLAVALLASLIPARRATKVDPIEALRYE